MSARAEGDKRAGIRVQSVERAIQILDFFRRTPELGVSEIAAKMDLSKSTVFGLINTLTAHGFLEQIESSKKYRLGIALFELGNLALSRIDLRSEARKVCAPLAEKYSVTVHVATHSEGEVIYIDKIECSDALISASSVGRRCPMHCTGVGKAMLAFLPESYLGRYIFNAPLRKMTEYTITDRTKLLEELETVRQTGTAIDRNEIELGLTCVAAPVFNYDGGPNAAVSVSFPYGRIQNVDLEEVRADLLRCTRRLSAQNGYHTEQNPH